MTERSREDTRILCDVCGGPSGYGDDREPWEMDKSKATWTCDDCIVAIKHATDQRLSRPGSMPEPITISFSDYKSRKNLLKFFKQINKK